MGGACGMCGRDEQYMKILERKPEGKGPQRGPRHRWKSNINMNPVYIICRGLDRINMAQDRNT